MEQSEHLHFLKKLCFHVMEEGVSADIKSIIGVSNESSHCKIFWLHRRQSILKKFTGTSNLSANTQDMKESHALASYSHQSSDGTVEMRRMVQSIVGCTLLHRASCDTLPLSFKTWTEMLKIY